MIEPPEQIFFGGSFDPPHVAHQMLVQSIRKHFPAVPITIIPSYQAPVKAGVSKKHAIDFLHRFEMARLSFESEQITVSDCEKKLAELSPGPSYFLNTLEYFYKKYLNQRLAFAIGTDQAVHFASWYQASEILKLADMIVFSRQGYPENFIDSLAVKLQLEFKLLNETCWQVFHTSLELPKRYLYFFKEQLPQVASTHMREQALDKTYLPEAVAEYIFEHKLYKG